MRAVDFINPLNSNLGTAYGSSLPDYKGSSIGIIDIINNNDKGLIDNKQNYKTFDHSEDNIIINGKQYNDDSVSMIHHTTEEFEKPKLLHNNVSKNVSIDVLTEYSLVIDSNDRDVTKYPNPFNYKVYFNPVSNTNDAYIYRTFENVKYIKLETGILPRKYFFTRNDITSNLDISDNEILLSTVWKPNETLILTSSGDLSGNFAIIEDYTDNSNRIIKFVNTNIPIIKTYELNNSILYEFTLLNDSLENEKYLLLNIDEYTNTNEMSTNQPMSKSFSILFPDYVNGDFFYVNTHCVDKIFRFADLGNIKVMSINIQNYEGILYKNQQNNTFIDSHANTYNKCICTNDTNGNKIINYTCCCSYLRHPNYAKFQNTLVFKIGVIENDIDKAVFS